MRKLSIGLWLIVCQGCDGDHKIFSNNEVYTSTHPSGRLLGVMDLDGDGELSEDEYGRVAEFPGTFASVDQDNSGGIDADEMTMLLWRFNPSENRKKSSNSGPKADRMTWNDWTHHAQNTGFDWGGDE